MTLVNITVSHKLHSVLCYANAEKPQTHIRNPQKCEFIEITHKQPSLVGRSHHSIFHSLSPNTFSLSLSLASGLSWFHTVWADSISRACFDWLRVLSLSILSLSLMAFCVGWRGLCRDRELSQCCHLQMQHPHLKPIAISPRADGMPAAKSTLVDGKREKGTRALEGEVK